MTRWLTLARAAEHMGASASTVKRLLAAGVIHWHVLPGSGLKRLDREEIDGAFVREGARDTGKGISDEDWRKYVR